MYDEVYKEIYCKNLKKYDVMTILENLKAGGVYIVDNFYYLKNYNTICLIYYSY